MSSLLVASASQTVGPFFKDGLHLEQGAVLFGENAAGRRVRVQGSMFDGEGVPVTDGLFEVWQCDASGRFSGVPADGGSSGRSEGFGRIYTDGNGAYSFDTVMPGVPSANGNIAPYLLLVIFARGLLRHVYTRMYFGGAPANATDPGLLAIPAERRATLIAAQSPQDADLYLFEIRLSGSGETVFLAY